MLVKTVIVHISALIIRIRPETNAFIIKVEHEIFNQYIELPSDAVWSKYIVNMHRLHSRHVNIVSAKSIRAVSE